MSFHRTLMHIDGDAFFASVYQATHADAQGKPVIIGKERGIATALSYEAKEYGVKRGMMVHEAKRMCPHAIIVTSDYRTYQIFSNKMLAIAESFSPKVERYSIDEVFLDVTGLDRIYNMSFDRLGNHIKRTIEKSLGLTVSAGIASSKTLTKIGSNINKPSGFAYIHDGNRDEYLRTTDIGDIWGIGYRLAPKLKGLGIHNAYEFTQAPEYFIASHFNKTMLETWYELQGYPMFQISPGHKIEYKSIRKSSTVTPATRDKRLLLARIYRHIENAFIKARRYKYSVGRVHIFLKTQEFTYTSTEIRIKEKAAYPYLIRDSIRDAFEKIYKPGIDYRASGCTLYDFESNTAYQQPLFNENAATEKKLKAMYPLYEKGLVKFGTDLLETRTYKRKSLFSNMQLR